MGTIINVWKFLDGSQRFLYKGKCFVILEMTRASPFSNDYTITARSHDGEKINLLVLRKKETRKEAMFSIQQNSPAVALAQ